MTSDIGVPAQNQFINTLSCVKDQLGGLGPEVLKLFTCILWVMG